MRGRFGQDRGAAVVEFAIVVPVLLLILFGLIDFGRLFFVQLSAKNAVREAARTWVVADTDMTLVTDEADRLAGISTFAGGTAPVWTWDPPGSTAGPTACNPSEPVVVSVTIPYRPLLPFGVNAMDVSASTTMRCEP